jgi:GT2 family glycosyltransferase
MAKPRVTVIVATYNRVPALIAALASVRQQTMPEWECLVVGDCCTPETGEAVAALGDPRMRFINLPERCFEQALPNSVGMALAQGEYLAFLNHDDFWLPDHLERAVAALVQHDADLFIGTAAFAMNPKFRDLDFTITEITPAFRTLREAFVRPFYYLEPISSWIVRRSAADLVGPMTPASACYRTPVEDWAMRAWRSGIKVVASDEITVVKDNTMPPKDSDGGTYSFAKSALAPLLELSALVSPDDLRTQLRSKHCNAVAAGHNPRDFLTPVFPPPPDMFKRLVTAEAATQFLETGEDAFAELCIACGFGKGLRARVAVKKRVGQSFTVQPQLDTLLLAAREQLASLA